MRTKERLTVTVDPELVGVATRAVERGLADSVSAWVSAAMAEHAARTRRTLALAEAVAAYESEAGALTEGEVAAQRLDDQRNAIVVRGVKKTG